MQVSTETYDEMGVSFDKIYYESETYLAGRDEVLVGLEKVVLPQEDGSVWADLSDKNLTTNCYCVATVHLSVWAIRHGDVLLYLRAYLPIPNHTFYFRGASPTKHFVLCPLVLQCRLSVL